MRENTISFKDVFQIDTSCGRILLGKNRYVLLEAAALGSMRRELIDSLGWESARGILQRAGYQCGLHDARQMRDQYSWFSDEEWFLSGPRLYCLEGLATVQLDQMVINKAEEKLHITGKWIDSFEADQHLQQYGAGHRSVCWILEGYASGYATECLGRDALCLETHCRAKGDSLCRFELRPAEAWGNIVHPIRRMLEKPLFENRFDRCLHMIRNMDCELEQTLLDAVVTTDAEGRIISCSKGTSEMLGIPPSEVIGKPISTFYGGGNAEVLSVMELLRKQRRLRNYLTELVAADGKKTQVALSASAVQDRKGKILGTIGVAHDLTEIRRLEDELSRKNRFMANILQDSGDAIITMDPNDVVTSWNKGAESIFGYLAGEMIGKPIKIIVPPELRKAHELEKISRRFLARGAVQSYQTERITKDGQRIRVLFTRTAIHDDSGKLLGSSSVIKDVTAFQSLERQLADAEHLATLGALSAGLAHEIKNPLAGIKGAIDVIRDSLPENDPHREILGDVIREVNRIDKTVRDLLSYAKPKPPRHSTIQLASLVYRIVAIARATSKHYSLPISVTQLAPLPDFTGDETQIEQVLLNLLLNAQNAMPPSGGHIEVVLNYDRETAVVRMDVKDDGPGIPEEIQKNIFQPFFTTRTDGAGLGLATCLKNVQYHGGSIDVHSEVGHGTTFTVTIPMLCHIR
jgi:PAS domain S-box-containing protein